MTKLGSILLLILLVVSPVFYSCGKDNLYSSVVQENNKQKAEDAIISGDYDSAISLLTSYIVENPTDYSAQSMLANAYELKAGINLLDLFIKMSNNISTSKNNLYAVLNSFPTGDSINIGYINTALQILTAIPSASRTSDQTYQIAVVNAALAFLMTKMDILDTSGTISTALVVTMSMTDSNTIYNSLVNVQTIFNSLGVVAGSGSGSGILLSIINGITVSGSSAGLITYLLANE